MNNKKSLTNFTILNQNINSYDSTINFQAQQFNLVFTQFNGCLLSLATLLRYKPIDLLTFTFNNRYVFKKIFIC